MAPPSHDHGIYSGSRKSYLQDMIAVGIIEDDATVREAFRDYCNAQAGMSCVAAEESAEDFLERMRSGDVPDVVLMDIGLPGMSGIEAIRFVRELDSRVNIIMLTVYMDTAKIFRSLCAGATGYLLKTTPFHEIKEAIEIVYRGGAPMSPQIARKVINLFQEGERKQLPSPLTPKEQQVVVGLVEGLSYKMIADRLDVTIETVRSHIKSIYTKLQVHGKAEVIARSMKGEI
jgi:DNA-binding NarL/FixJ family response regulator